MSDLGFGPPRPPLAHPDYRLRRLRNAAYAGGLAPPRPPLAHPDYRLRQLRNAAYAGGFRGAGAFPLRPVSDPNDGISFYSSTF